MSCDEGEGPRLHRTASLPLPQTTYGTFAAVSGLGFTVYGLRFRVYGLWLRV